MSATLIAAVGGLTTGVLALFGVAYALGYKFGKFETKLSFLWGIQMEEAIQRQSRQGNLRRTSELQLTDQLRNGHFHDTVGAQPLNPVIRENIESLARKRRLPKETSEISFMIVQTVGFDLVAARAEELEVPMHDFLALCVAWVLELRKQRP